SRRAVNPALVTVKASQQPRPDQVRRMGCQESRHVPRPPAWRDDLEKGRPLAEPMGVQVRRVYEEPAENDGTRVLVDRIWPRGLTKAKASLDEWCKAVAPSTDLRTWYGHDPAKFAEFARRYRIELHEAERAQALLHLRDLAADRRVTLLTGTKDPDISEAAVLAAILNTPGRR
ncbi:MAG TPA: DUF488 family protein, partial [Microlunatus sp.]|nr:DUF488 family protein [Microlunatus sp.]